MIHNEKFIQGIEPKLMEALEMFHYGLGRRYDLTILSGSDELNQKIKEPSWLSLVKAGKASVFAVNKFAYRYKESREILSVIAWMEEQRPGIRIEKSSGEKWDSWMITFEKKKKEKPEPIKVDFSKDPYEEEEAKDLPEEKEAQS